VTGAVLGAIVIVLWANSFVPVKYKKSHLGEIALVHNSIVILKWFVIHKSIKGTKAALNIKCFCECIIQQ
jgi:hypothetical protein